MNDYRITSRFTTPFESPLPLDPSRGSSVLEPLSCFFTWFWETVNSIRTGGLGPLESFPSVREDSLPEYLRVEDSSTLSRRLHLSSPNVLPHFRDTPFRSRLYPSSSLIGLPVLPDRSRPTLSESRD